MSVWSGCKADTPGAVKVREVEVRCWLCGDTRMHSYRYGYAETVSIPWTPYGTHGERHYRECGTLVRELPDGRVAQLPCPRCGGKGFTLRGVYSVERYKGCVLADRERNFRDDSDFYAVVWNEEHQKVHTVEWGTTRFAMVGCGCSVDATEEVQTKAQAYLGRVAVEEYKVNARREARLPAVGKLVQTVNTRKVPPGTRGVVFWIGADNYRRGAVRVGIELEDGQDRLFFADHNVEVVAPDQYLENLDAEAERYAGGHEQWHQPFVHPGMVSM